MDLANMRWLGCRSILLECDCGHQASVNVDSLDDGVYVPAVKNHCRCSKCGKKPRLSRPDWSGYRPSGTGVL